MGLGCTQRLKKLKRGMEFYWNFQGGGGALNKNPFGGEGMDNYFMELHRYTVSHDQIFTIQNKNLDINLPF